MSKKAVITILGTIGISDNQGNIKQKATYDFFGKRVEHYNTFTMLIENYSNEYDILPFYTDQAKAKNKEILEFQKQNDKNFASIDIDRLFSLGYRIKDEQDFESIFASIHEAVNNSNYESIIFDVSHGFRHLPILAIIDLVISNFKDSKKIEKILFAKEVISSKKYEIIDLKEYLDIANIAFILGTFNNNYTVASHIKSKSHPKLISSLKNFSNDIMSLNLAHIYSHSAKELINELEKITSPEIKLQAKILRDHIQKLLSLKDGFLPHELYYHFCRDLFKKDYIFLSVAFLFESLRLYIVHAFQSKDNLLYNDIKQITLRYEKENPYSICDTFIKLLKKQGETLNKTEFSKIFKKNYEKQACERIAKNSYQIPNILDTKIKDLYKKIEVARNSLAHIENESYENIKLDIQKLVDKYFSLVQPKITNL